MNPLRQLEAFGQSVWIDYIRRDLLTGGRLQQLIERDGVTGLTSNPSIFEKAIAAGGEYEQAIRAALRRGDVSSMKLYESLAIEDICMAADLMRPVYDATRGRDGYVSLEVSPHLAHDTEATILEAHRLWRAVGRPNLMIKVPGTREGLPAIEALIGEGVNVNVTLLFSRAVYERAAEAYLRGLERRATAGEDLGQVASVASFFVSRIDTRIDDWLERRARSAPRTECDVFLQLRGKAAIANAKLAYRTYQRLVSDRRWKKLAARGARPQRLLWGSTSTKNPAYRDVVYVEELIGPDTVNTMPPATLEAFRDHGVPRASLEQEVEAAEQTLQMLEVQGISMDQVTAQLLDEGVRLFAQSFDQLLAAVERARAAA